MAHHGEAHLTESDTKKLGSQAFGLFTLPLAVGIAGLCLAALIALMTSSGEGRGLERFAHAYLWAYVYIASLSFGCFALIFISTLFRGHWQILFRRVWEIFAMQWLPLLLVLALPIVFFAARTDGLLYSWNKPTENGELQHTHQIVALTDPALIEEFGIYPPNYFIDKPGAYEALKPLQHQKNPFTNPSLGDTHGMEQVYGGHDDHEGHEGHGHDDHEGHLHGSLDEATTTSTNSAETSATEPGDAGHGDEHAAHNNPLIEGKLPYLDLPFWTVRVLGYCVFLGLLMRVYHGRSIKMDTEESDDVRAALTRANEKMVSWGTILFGCVLTFFSFDLAMSLDPTWYSTMYGIRYFAGCMIGALSLTVVVFRVLQAKGFLSSVNQQHYHDLGKLMFAMTFFWTYVTFSQYMLIWYASVPGELPYFTVRGASTVEGSTNAFTLISLFLIFGHFLFPWCFLLSRHIKLNLKTLTFIAGWMLFAHAVDIYWDIMAEFDNQFIFGGLGNFLIDLGCLVGLVGLFLAFSAKLAAKMHLVPIQDPRVARSISHENLY